MNPTITLEIDLETVLTLQPNEPVSFYVMPSNRVRIYIVQEDASGAPVVRALVVPNGIDIVTIVGPQ